MNKFLKILGLIVLTVFLSGCEEDDDNLASMVQKCLNEIPQNGGTAEANACLAIAGSSTNSRVLRAVCALKFIQDNISKADLIAAFSGMLDNAGAQASPLLYLSASLAASSVGVANDIVQTCERSGSVALTMMANASKLGRLAIDSTGQTIPDNIAGAISGSPADDTAVGEIALSIIGTYCDGGKKDKVCNAMDTAVNACGGTSNPACLGNWLQQNCLGVHSCGT